MFRPDIASHRQVYIQRFYIRGYVALLMTDRQTDKVRMGFEALKTAKGVEVEENGNL
jgi:hypothetical protein